MSNNGSRMLKKRALELISKAFPAFLLVSFVWFALSILIGEMDMRLMGVYYAARDFGVEVRKIGLANYAANYEEPVRVWFSSLREHGSTLGSILSVALNACITVVSVGFSWFCLRVARGEKPEFRALFDSFGFFVKIIWLTIVRSVMIFLQLLLFIVPGVIAMFRYSQAYNVLHDHPEYGAMQCLRESKRIMQGQKVAYLVLMLSFIGWLFVGTVVGWFLYIPLTDGGAIGIPLTDVWMNLYFSVTAALFYDYIRRRVAVGEPDADVPVVDEPPVIRIVETDEDDKE